MSVVTKTELNKRLEYPGARRAFKRLVKGGANPGILENLLMLRVIFGDLPEYKHWLPARRSVNSMSAKMRALALQIRELNRFPGIFAEFSGDRVSSANTDQRLDIPVRSERLGEMLIRYAADFRRSHFEKEAPRIPLQDATGRSAVWLSTLERSPERKITRIWPPCSMRENRWLESMPSE